MTKKTFKIEKLVRDLIPQLLRTRGIVPQEAHLKDDIFIHNLQKKLIEECMELSVASNDDEILEELADVLEVFYSLSEIHGFSVEEVEKVRLQKRLEKGGFEDKTYIHSVEIEEGSEAEKYYLKNSHRYPEVTSSHRSDCLFCQISREERGNIIEQFEHCYVIRDEFPVSKGHSLIIPKEHTENWFTARKEVQEDMLAALEKVKKQLDDELQPDGYNIGINCGEAAGQSIFHLHLHLIPRYAGDMKNPKGGVRGVIPSKQNY